MRRLDGQALPGLPNTLTLPLVITAHHRWLRAGTSPDRFLSDQYLWAHVVSKNKLGPKGVDMNRMSSKKLSAAIEQLTQRPEYESNAQALSQRVRGVDGAKNAVQVFERLQGRFPAEKSLSLAMA